MGAYSGVDRDQARATLDRLRAAVAYRAAYREQERLGWPGRICLPERPVFTLDPAWLVTMAINRKAGWPDDPSLARGSAMPVQGRYPKRAEGDGGEYQASQRLSWQINYTRVRVRAAACPPRYRARLAHRLVQPGEEN